MRVYKNVWPNHKLSARHSLQTVKSKKLEKDIPYKYNQKKVRVALITIIVNIKVKTITKDKEGHYIMIKRVNSPRRQQYWMQMHWKSFKIHETNNFT